MALKDQLGRPLRDLRISVTDRCNFRCSYCMPKDVFGGDYGFLKRSELLTFEEITRLVRLLRDLGIRKVRLTGGEPLLRHQVHALVEMLGQIPDLDLAMTTNGAFLAEKADMLKQAGLDRVTVSLDSLDGEIFARMNGVGFPVAKILEGIQAADQAGLNPIKINMMVRRGVNEDSILPMAQHFRGTGHILRFIEFMDVGCTNGWRMDEVVTAKEIIETLDSEFPIEPVDPHYRGEVANRWRYKDGQGEIGVIASVTQAFCQDCTRLRLSAKGELYTCLFGLTGHNMHHLLRGDASDEEIIDRVKAIWQRREDHYSEIRSAETNSRPKVEMSYIGG